MKSRINSSNLYARACALMPGGVNSPVRACKSVGGTPVYIKEAHGPHLVDADGNTYVDFCQSWGPLILGHAHPEVVDAVQKAAAQGLSYGACHEKEIKLAELVLQGCPGFDMIRFVNSGTEAVMTALRLARGATGRDLIVKFEGGYHGHTDTMLVKAGSGLVTQGMASSAGVPATIAETTIVAEFDNEALLSDIFMKYGPRIAAVIMEPLPANNGLLIQRQKFLHTVRDLTSASGSLLIFDEVISGFRVCYGGYYQQLGITPDILTFGKIIGGGMPVGAVVGTRQIMQLLAPIGPVYQAGTLSGNPVGLAAGIATLTVLAEKNPYEQLSSLATIFLDELSEDGSPHCLAVKLGSIIWPYFAATPFPRAPQAISAEAVERYNAVYSGLLDDGYYLPPSAYEVLFLSIAHTEEQVRGLAKAMRNRLLKLDGTEGAS